ncbi:hypothetical protein BD289DRAFT_445953 [Coniella lustricola]|uniref:Uncharacterized protein n=1 Tax=Coniella lustricola TaxID=2025994 RepID=A0A2T2ZUD7_9PEZI|nr:hypothetical protein BD289DRAFT_445953 [Coniella lustricola]
MDTFMECRWTEQYVRSKVRRFYSEVTFVIQRKGVEPGEKGENQKGKVLTHLMRVCRYGRLAR